MHAAIHDRRRMRQYGCEQERTKASSRRDAKAARDAGGRCAPRRPRPRARNVRGGRATRTYVSRSSRGNRSDGPRSHVTPARMPSCASRSRTARVSRSIVSSSPCAWAVARRAGGSVQSVLSRAGRCSRAFSAPGCGIASLYAAREAAYAGIASPPDMEWRPKIPQHVLVGQRAANRALCVEASESTIVRLTRSLAQLPSRRDLVRRRSRPALLLVR